MTSLEFARRLKQANSKITCNSMNPGLIPTTGERFDRYWFDPHFHPPGLFRDLNPVFVYIFSFLTRYIFKVAATEEEGGRRLAFMISSPVLNGVSGAYFSGKPGTTEFSPISPSTEAQNESKGKRLFELTSNMLKDFLWEWVSVVFKG